LAGGEFVVVFVFVVVVVVVVDVLVVGLWGGCGDCGGWGGVDFRIHVSGDVWLVDVNVADFRIDVRVDVWFVDVLIDVLIDCSSGQAQSTGEEQDHRQDDCLHRVGSVSAATW
jgi:hypothetical protein